MPTTDSSRVGRGRRARPVVAGALGGLLLAGAPAFAADSGRGAPPPPARAADSGRGAPPPPALAAGSGQDALPPPAGAASVQDGVLSSLFDADFENDGLFSSYETPLTQGNGRHAKASVVDAPHRSGRAVRFVMPPSRGTRRDTPNRMQLAPAGGMSWRDGSDAWYGISLYVGKDWKLSQVVDDRRHFATLFSFRWRDISHRKNGPGGGIVMSRVSGDSLPHFVAERETRGWAYRDGGHRDPVDLGPVTKGRWIDFVVHVRWSAKRRGGLREYWRDGRLMGRSRLRNLGTDSPVVHRMGLYQGTAVDHQRTLYWDNHRIGRSYAEVDPSRD